MAAVETSTTAALVGSGIVSATTYVLGPVLGEYAVILGAGLLGSLVALMEEKDLGGTHPYWEGLKFVFRGTTLSFMFGGLLTMVAIQYVPASYHLSAHAILSPVSFSIGWTSNRWGIIKDKIVNVVSRIKLK